MKYVNETKAGKAISAYVIMKGRRHVATVRSHYSDTGRVLVNVWQDSDAVQRCAVKAKMSEKKKAYDHFLFQHASAGGYGYDKFTAALSHMWIDGHQLGNHCARQIVPSKEGVFPAGFTAPKGYTLANWCPELAGWRNCFRLAGLDYLRDHGYQIVQAI